MTPKDQPLVTAFCEAMIPPLAALVKQIPKITERDLNELSLLTYGSQLQGSNNTQIGKAAMKEVFVAVSEIVGKFATEKKDKRLLVKNSAGRTVVITLSHDPDVSIEEQVGKNVQHRVAVEVKGGTDVSNAHNRAGEAEKSHQKAKGKGFPEFWTIISKKGLDITKLKSESPTTHHWFDVAEVLARNGTDWELFKQRLAVALGIPLKE